MRLLRWVFGVFGVKVATPFFRWRGDVDHDWSKEEYGR